MTKFELLKDYVEHQVEQMHDAVDWARERMGEYERPFRLEWAHNMIEKENADATGAISFAAIWAEEITEEEKEQLLGILFNGWETSRERAGREI